MSEIEAPTGSFKLDLDTARLRELRVDELSLDDAAPWAAAHFSPCDNAAGRALAPVERSAHPDAVAWTAGAQRGDQRRRDGDAGAVGLETASRPE